MNLDTLMAIFMLIFQVLGYIGVRLFLILHVREAAARICATRGQRAALVDSQNTIHVGHVTSFVGQNLHLGSG